jgi:short-subunit dehydrogenase
MCCPRDIPRARPGADVALVTGACSGIGRELADLLGAAGYTLLLASNRADELGAVASQLAAAHGVTAHALVLDLAAAGSAQELHSRCSALGLQPHVLCINAGIFFFGEVADTDPARAEALLGVHVVSASLLALLFARDMRARRAGFILITSSISAWGSFPGIAFYGASKHYLKSFALSLASELSVHNVGVTCLAPGATATALYDNTGVPARTAEALGVMMGPRAVAREGLQALFRRRALSIPGCLPKLFAFFMAILPLWLINCARRRVPWLPQAARAPEGAGKAALDSKGRPLLQQGDGGGPQSTSALAGALKGGGSGEQLNC